MRRTIEIRVTLDDEPGDNTVGIHVETTHSLSQETVMAIGSAASRGARALSDAVDALVSPDPEPEPAPEPRPRPTPIVKSDSRSGRA